MCGCRNPSCVGFAEALRHGKVPSHHGRDAWAERRVRHIWNTAGAIMRQWAGTDEGVAGKASGSGAKWREMRTSEALATAEEASSGV